MATARARRRARRPGRRGAGRCRPSTSRSCSSPSSLPRHRSPPGACARRRRPRRVRVRVDRNWVQVQSPRSPRSGRRRKGATAFPRLWLANAHQEETRMSTSLQINGKSSDRQRRARHAAAVGDSRRARADRHQVRLRRGAVRRLHRAPRRRAGALLPDAAVARRPARSVTTIEGLSSDRGRPARPGGLDRRTTCRSAATASRARS